jgi:hypothetical protein
MLPILATAQSPTAVRPLQSSLSTVSFAISAASGEVKAGLPVKVHGVLRNTGKEDLSRLGNNLNGRTRSYAKVSNAAGNLAIETKLGARFNGHVSTSELEDSNSKPRNFKSSWTTIKPGNAIEWDEDVTKQYELSRPGTYKVQLEESIWSRAPGDTQLHPTLYKSNVITITVVP